MISWDLKLVDCPTHKLNVQLIKMISQQQISKFKSKHIFKVLNSRKIIIITQDTVVIVSPCAGLLHKRPVPGASEPGDDGVQAAQ